MSEHVLTQVFLQLQNEVTGFFLNRLHCIETSRDLSQEVFLRLQRTDASKEITNHRSYIFTTARNLLKDHVRNEVRRSNLLVENDPILWIHREEPTPEMVLAGRDDLAILRSVIKDLPLKSRQIFHAHRFLKKTRREIAAEFGVSLTTVENHIRLVLDQFHEALK